MVQNFAKFLAKKFGSKEKSATFALPNEKRGLSCESDTTSSLKRLKFILYKKQVPRKTKFIEKR